MKNILVPTDFSLTAENASKYAFALASSLQADILLCNAFKIPAKAPLAGNVVWPLMEYATLKDESNGDLRLMAKKLVHACSKTEQYKPIIEVESVIGNTLKMASLLVQRRNIDLVVMGMAGSGAVTQFILGSNTRSMIDKAPFPVLYIPHAAHFKPIKTIAFATSLSLEDIPQIIVMMQLLSPLGFQIRLMHVSEKEVGPNSKMRLEINKFLKAVTNQIHNTNIVYEDIWDIDVDNGLDWITEQADIDLIAVVHHSHTFLESFFKGSHTQKLARCTEVPLLVLPSKKLTIA